MIAIDELVRSRRRSIALIVQRDGRLVVRAPLRATRAEIQQVLEKHAEWIQKKQAQAKAALALNPPRAYESGDEFWYLGAPRRLDIREGGRPALTLEGATFHLSRAAQARAASVFRDWYRSQAVRYIPERVSALASRLGFQPRGVRITSARTRWGSCSPGGVLAFTWRLMVAPQAVIDYVILHELVHLEIRNHSSAFWGRVAALAPDYKTHVRWLKKYGPLALDL